VCTVHTLAWMCRPRFKPERKLRQHRCLLSDAWKELLRVEQNGEDLSSPLYVLRVLLSQEPIDLFPHNLSVSDF